MSVAGYLLRITLKKEDIKIYPAPLYAPRQELFIRILKSAVALSVSWEINFVCVRTGHLIQLYDKASRSEMVATEVKAG